MRYLFKHLKSNSKICKEIIESQHKHSIGGNKSKHVVKERHHYFHEYITYFNDFVDFMRELSN